MRKSALVLGLVATLICSNTQAGTIDAAAPVPAPGGGDLILLTLNTAGMEGSFDTFELILTSDGLFNQVGTPGDLILPGPSDDTGFFATLTAPPSFGGNGLSQFGVSAATDTDSLLSGTFASLGSNAASDQGNIQIAQVVIPPSTQGNIEFFFFNDGNLVGAGGGTFGVPEPTSLVLLGLGLALVSRRRS